MRIIFCLLLTVLWLAGNSQPQTAMRIDTTRESMEYWDNWLNDLFDMSVNQKNDSILVRGEVFLTFKDSALRKSLYPGKYEMPGAIELMKGMELKKGFWHLINIYMQDTSSRSMIMGMFVLYDSLMEMDKVLLNAFYTYAFADPRVSRMNNNKPDIYRPDLLEKHLYETKEIINYIWAYRQKRNSKAVPKTNK